MTDPHPNAGWFRHSLERFYGSHGWRILQVTFISLVTLALGFLVFLAIQQSQTIAKNNQSNDVSTCRGQQRAGIDSANLEIAAASTAEGELRTEFGLAQASGQPIDLAPWVARAKVVEKESRDALDALDKANRAYKAGATLSGGSVTMFLSKCRADGYL